MRRMIWIGSKVERDCLSNLERFPAKSPEISGVCFWTDILTEAMVMRHPAGTEEWQLSEHFPGCFARETQRMEGKVSTFFASFFFFGGYVKQKGSNKRALFHRFLESCV